MKIAGNLLVLNTTDRLYIEWCDMPFDLNISVLWRGLYFDVNIKAFKIENGSTRIATIYFNKKKHAYGLTKWKYLGGHHGDSFPIIETTTNKLRFHLALDFLEILDIPMNSSNNEQGDNSFLVFYQS